MKVSNPVTVTGDGNETQVTNKIKITKKSSVAIGTVVVVVIGIVAAILLGGNGGSPSNAIVGDWTHAGGNGITISFNKDGTYFGSDGSNSETGTYKIDDKKSLIVSYTVPTEYYWGIPVGGNQEATYEWNQTRGDDFWYISKDQLIFGGNIFVRVK